MCSIVDSDIAAASYKTIMKMVAETYDCKVCNYSIA